MKTRIPALSGTVVVTLALAFAAAVGATNPGNRAYVAKLSSANEVPALSTGATGTALIKINTQKQELCWLIHAKGLSSTATAAHIHAGTARATGGIVVTLSAPSGSKKNATSKGCVKAGSGDLTLAELSQILANPKGFYVNVHTATYGNGEVRGQLKRS